MVEKKTDFNKNLAVKYSEFYEKTKFRSPGFDEKTQPSKLVLDMNTQLSVSLKLMRKLSCQGTRIARLSFSESLNVYTKTLKSKIA